ncbi:TRAP transporter small permease [Salimicrobium halophilum]|uniref:TRAP-type C4-dicarboxylate transport system, small permease component n=1 Tax=Salimicrobium halophilum TaxID=86666 RepID=A0A1G8S9W0_9BACI|nr:TRAP transporter small permease [Salimicrobium halophilum]SDJ26022.1 TRAP-type C4-dicarboxylate transport system, small permease component [Salimicrobium halophilum]
MAKAVHIIERIQTVIGLSFLTLFFGVLLYQIITRHLGISVIWTEELASYSFVWSVFMGAAVMVNRKEHFSFDMLVKKLKGKSLLVLLTVNDIILLVFNSALFVYGLQVVREFWNNEWIALSFMKMGYVWIAIPLMAGTMIIYTLHHLINRFQKVSKQGVESWESS